jgi:hypothetical protein
MMSILSLSVQKFSVGKNRYRTPLASLPAAKSREMAKDMGQRIGNQVNFAQELNRLTGSLPNACPKN